MDESDRPRERPGSEDGPEPEAEYLRTLGESGGPYPQEIASSRAAEPGQAPPTDEEDDPR